MISKLVVGCLTALLLLASTAGEAHAKTTLKYATLAPKSSAWGKVFNTWVKAVEKKTDGEVQIDWQWGGIAGDETAVVGKIKSGQLAGAAVTAVGLSAIKKDALALQIPGLFNSWKDLDRARDKFAADFNEAAKREGFHIGGWGDVGIGRVMSKGFPVRVPADLKGKRPGMIDKDIIAPKVYEVIGGVTGVPGTVPSFLPALDAGKINVMNVSSLAADALQWASRLTHINTAETYYGIGAVVMSQKQLDKLTADQREILISTGKLAAEALTKRIRKEDDKAFERLKKKMKVHEPTAAEKAEWKKVFKKACERLKGAIPGGAINKVGGC